jgi:hypothetical protein
MLKELPRSSAFSIGKHHVLCKISVPRLSIQLCASLSNLDEGTMALLLSVMRSVRADS